MRKGVAGVLLVVMCVALASAQRVRSGSQVMVPDGKGGAVAAPPGRFAEVTPDTVHTGNGIDYHNGPIMPGTVNVYLIFYGKWKNGAQKSDSPATKRLIKQFIQGVSGSDYEMINSTYGDNNNDVTGLVNLAGFSGMGYVFGANLSDSAIKSIVAKKINNGTFPSDTNGVYFVLTSSDVSETSGFCTGYCGWHHRGMIGGKDIKFSFVGNADRCPAACGAQTKGPNNNSGGDSMVNIIAHELEEAISDPDLNAWFDTVGAENADKCVWKFGDILGGTNGVDAYNETFGGHNWYIQMNWENARGGGCDNFLGGPFHNH